MSKSAKTAQLQMRISTAEKAAIQRAAARAGLDMSTYVRSRVLPVAAAQFQDAVGAATAEPRFALAEFNSLLSGFTAGELREALAAPPTVRLTPYLANYVAAMVEFACARRAIPVPAWTRAIAPLPEPVFGSSLMSLRLYLLTHSPAPFRRRNIFVDATLGDRV